MSDHEICPVTEQACTASCYLQRPDDARERSAVERRIATLETERAELRGDVAALWQRLGDVLSLIDGKEYMAAEDQDKIRNARELHALWRETDSNRDKP